MAKAPKLELGLYGDFLCRWSDGRELRISSAKQRALLALLALAAQSVHSRSWLQEHLWGRAGEDHGRASLRRALSDLRRTFGADFDDIFDVSNTEIRLQSDRIELINGPASGPLLQSVSIQEPLFQTWLKQHRRAAGAVDDGLERHTRLAMSPAIAVLPLMQTTGEANERHLGDLFSLEVARALSRSKLIDVISHMSSRRFAGPSLDLAALQETLSADYAIHGNVRVSGAKVRADVDFFDVSTGRIVWTRSYASTIADILNGNSDIVRDVARDSGQAVLSASIELSQTRPLPEVASHALFMMAIVGMHQHHLSSFSRARDQLEELLRRFPAHSVLHAWLAKWYILSISQGWSTEPERDSQTAIDCTARALDINPNCAVSLTIDGMIQGDRQVDMSVSERRFEQATQIDPNQALAWLMYSRMNSFLGNGAQAVQFAEKARRLSPLDPHGYFYDIMSSFAHFVNGDWLAAQSLAKKSIAENPRHTSSYRVLAMAQQSGGDEAAARATVAQLRRLEPGLTIESYLATHPAGRLSTGRHWAELLGAAGLPRS